MFGLVVLASKYANKSKKKYDLRLQFKTKLLRLLLESGYRRRDIEQLFFFIQQILVLPEKWQSKFKEEVRKTIKKKKYGQNGCENLYKTGRS